jgi:uncharacterized protein (DUF1015 family)
VTDSSLFAPFRGERYADPGTLGPRLAPPYDVISPDQRASLAGQDPYNIVRLDLPSAVAGDRYREAARLLADWRAQGQLVRDAEPTAYVLQTSGGFPDGSRRERTGVFLAAAAEPFSRGRVRPHERTHAGPKEDRRRLTQATGCNLSPVFLLAPDSSGRLEQALREVVTREPWARCSALGSEHAVWVVTGGMADRIAEAAGAEPVYVADGHHRFETAVLFREEAKEAWRAGASRTLSHVVSFRDPGLEILPTHRLVVGDPLRPAAFVEAASPFLVAVPDGADWTLIAVFADGTEIRLGVRPGADLTAARDLPEHPVVRALAVTMADGVAVGIVAAALLGRAPELRYTPDAGEAREAARSGSCALALILPATRLEEVRRVADAGQIMPPKSTFFAPKVPTGVVLRPLDAPV